MNIDALEVQKLIFSRLKATAGPSVKGVYDFRPTANDPADPKNYPVIIFGEDVFNAAETDTSSGAEAECKISIYSASKSMEEVKKLASLVTTAFDREELSSATVDVVACNVESVAFIRDERINIAEITLKLFIDEV